MESQRPPDAWPPARGQARVDPPARADPADHAAAASYVAFGRQVLLDHYARADGHCGCGRWLADCPVRRLAGSHGVPVDPVLRVGLRISPVV